MATITSFDKKNLETLKNEMDAAFAAINKKFGIQLAVGNIVFSGPNATIKVEAATISTTGVVLSKEVVDFNSHKDLVGLSAFHVGQTVKIQGKDYTIVGYVGRSKAPVIIARMGKEYRVATSTILSENK